MRLVSFDWVLPCAAICAALVMTPATFAQVATRAEHDDHALLISHLLDGQTRHDGLLEAALVASGAASRADFARSRFVIDRCVAEVQTPCRADCSTDAIQQLAAAILTVVHDSVLIGGFDGRCNNLCSTLENGDFNCVTASTVFLIVARRLDCDAQIELLPNHLRCRVSNGSSQYIVETTDQGGVHVAAGPPEGRLLSDSQLLAKLYYNRALDLLYDQQFGLALQHAELAWRLDPVHVEAQENLAIVACRWATALAHQHRWPLAISLLRRTAMSTDQEAMVAAAEVFVLTSWIQTANADGSHPELRRQVAQQLLAAIARRPSSQPLLQLVQRLPLD